MTRTQGITSLRAAIRLVSRPAVKSYRSASGRYAVAKIRGGLFVPTAEIGKVEIGACRLSFIARKRG